MITTWWNNSTSSSPLESEVHLNGTLKIQIPPYRKQSPAQLTKTHRLTLLWEILSLYRVNNWKHTNKLLHSVVCLTTGPQPLPRRVLHRVRSSKTSSFNCKYPPFSLRSSTTCLSLLSRLLFTFIFLSVTCCRRQFLCMMWPIQLVFLISVVSRIFLSSLTLCNNHSFSHDRSKLSSRSFSSPSSQTFPGIFGLFSEMFKFQQHKKLCSKCSNLLVSSLNLSPICW
jgi:hypothetical protein